MAAAATGVEAWSGMLTDAVAKCGRDSERKTYMYGISVNRCPKCQAKLRAESNTCTSCHYTHKTQRKCLRCNKNKEPVMWCVECDEYFCSTCHKKPHVLMLGSSKPHHCFAVDGVSGKYFVEAAWSGDFTAMVQSTYRQLRREKIAADAVKEKAPTQAPTGQQPTPVAVTKAVPTINTSADVLPTTAAIGGLSSTPTAAAQEQSRKRQLSGPDDKRGKKSMRSEELSHSGGKSGTTSTEGMSLYERVKAMHDQRAKTARSNAVQPKSPKMRINQILTQQDKEQQIAEQAEQEKRKAEQALQQQRGQSRQQEQERAEQLKKEQQQRELQRQEEKRQHEEQRQLQGKRLQEKKQQQEEQRRMEEEKRLQKEQRLLEELQRENEKHQREVKRREEELRQEEEERLREELRKQKQFQEEKKKRLIEQIRHEEIMRQQQAGAQALMHEGNRFVSQAQQVLRAQPGYAASSLAPPTIPVSMPQTSNDRFTRLASPVSIPTHDPRFQALPSPSHSSQGFPATHGASNSNGYSSVGKELGSQVYERHTDAPVPRFETISHDHEENHRMVIRESGQRQQQSDFSDAMVPHRITGAAASGGFSPSKSGENDELRAIWVSDYDNVNTLVMQLDVEISKRTEEGHSFVHRSNNITIPEQLKLQINNLRAQRDAALKKRFESVVRVLIFSDAVRSFAQQNENTNIWSDVPEVQKASHKKCAELASDIREFERQAQKLREGIDEAVSSGNPEQMQNVARLGALIADLEQKIRASNGERDKQFIFMFQFSNTLRSMVRAEWAASRMSYQLQGSE